MSTAINIGLMLNIMPLHVQSVGFMRIIFIKSSLQSNETLF